MKRISFEEATRSADGVIKFADRSRKPVSNIGPGNLPTISVNPVTADVTESAPVTRKISFEEATRNRSEIIQPTAVEPEAPEQESRWTMEAFAEGAKDYLGAVTQSQTDRFNAVLSRAGVISPDSPDYVAGVGMDDPFALDRAIKDRKEADVRNAEQQGREGFLGSIGNPLDLMANEGASQFLIRRGVGQALNIDRLNMDVNEKLALEQQEARQLAARQRILANPSQFPQVSVDAARVAQAEYEAKEAKTVGQEAGEMVDNLAKQFEERPTETLATFANAIIADPAMAFAPVGMGAKPIQAARSVARVAPVIPGTRTAAAVTAADKIADAALTGALTNVGVEEIIAFDQGRELTAGERAANAGIGAVAAGGIQGVVQIFSRGKSARGAVGNPVSLDTLNQALQDLDVEGKVIDRVMNNPESYDPTVVNRVNELVGITPDMTNGQKVVAYIRRKKEIEEAFANAEQQKRDVELANNPPEGVLDRRVRFANDFEKALAQRAERAKESAEARVAADAELAQAAKRLDEEDIIAEAFESSAAVRQAMERARVRDSRLARPKWQRGSAPPELLMRLGAGALFGSAAFALADEDYKTGAAFAAGLAGLALPGGGNVRNIMRQAGAISYGDSIPSVNFKRMSDKLAESRGEAPKPYSQVMEEDFATIQRALQGDQAAYKKLYDDYNPAVIAAAKRMGTKIAPRLGMEVEDIAQEIMAAIFKSLPNYKPVAPFGAFIEHIAKQRMKDYFDKANAGKRQGEFKTASIFNDANDFGPGSARSGHIMEGDAPMYNQLADAEPAVSDWSSSYNLTPETAAIRDQAVSIIQNTIDRMNPRMRESFKQHHENGMSPDEIAEMTGQPTKTVYDQIARAEHMIAEAVGKGLNARKVAPTQVAQPEVKRGRGRPRKNQEGSVDPRVLTTTALIALGGAAVGAALNNENEAFGSDIHPAFWGAALGVAGALALRGKTVRGQTYGAKLIEGADYTLGVTSTQVKNISQQVWRRAVEFERAVLRDTHKYLEQVSPFVTIFEKLPPETRDVLARAILTGRGEVTNRILQAIGDRDLIDGWKQTRSALDSLRDQLVALKRFVPSDLEYFPRIVKDVPGLLKAIGADAKHPLTKLLDDARTKSLAKSGNALTEAEESLIISRYLAAERVKGNQPGFAKDRGVEEITPELQQYYASPIESLNSYIRSAVDDIERAKFFGKNIVTTADGNKLYTNVDASVGEIVKRELDAGMNPEEAAKLGDLLRARFINGDKVPNTFNRAFRDLSYAGLLGNIGSAIVQFGDVALQAYTQGMIPTISAVVKTLTNRKLVDMKDFGLQDHITAELLGQGKTTKLLNTVFKYSQFTRVDQFGKNVALNAAVISAARKAKTPQGIAEIEAKWRDALQPGEIKQLVADLQKGEVTDLVRSVAFAELSRTQPISRLEMPPAYLNNPNGRLLYSLKTFTIKQIDLLRRDAYNEIKAGRIKQGVANLANIAVVMSVSGVATSAVRDYIIGREVNLEGSDFAFNVLKTYGLSEFYLDRALGISKEDAAARRLAGDRFARQTEATPLRATVDLIVPPVKMFDEIIRADPVAVRYLPIIGPVLLEDQRAAQEAARGGSR